MSQPSQVYLLAAGQGKRAGGPKAWLQVDGEPLLKKQIDFLLGLFDPERLTVSIQEDWLAKCRMINERVKWVAVDPEAAPLASLQALIKASPMVRWSFVYHVDHPVFEQAVFQMLLRETANAKASAFVPVSDAKRGHPLLVSHGLGPKILELDPAKDRLDAFMRTQTVSEVLVPFPCVLENWNDGAPAPPSGTAAGNADGDSCL